MRRNEPTEKERFTVILEHLYGEIKTIKEGQNAIETRLNKRLDVVVEELSEVKSTVRLLAKDLGLVKQDVAALKTEMIEVKVDLRELRTHIPPIHDVLMDHEHRLKKFKAL